MSGRGSLIALWLVSLCCLACRDKPESNEITLFAAASTGGVFDDLARLYGARTGRQVRLSYAASSVLARQIENGASADIFISANPLWMDFLEKRHLIDGAMRRNLLGNNLVLIGGPDLALADPFSKALPALPERWPGKLATGDPNHVPLGIYARQALGHLGWWVGFQDRVVAAANAHAALLLVKRGEVGLGIVYTSDAVRAEMRVLATFPADSHEPVVYPAALHAEAKPAARAFFEFLFSAEAHATYRKYGFAVIGVD